MRRSLTTALLGTTVGLVAGGLLATGPAPAAADRDRSDRELTETRRLADRRSLVVGERFWSMGAQDGSYPATGFHTRGEMGGFWTPPIKLLDGVWFRLGDDWLTARSYTSGRGYQRMDLGTHDGVRVTRTDLPAGDLRAGLVGLRLDADRARTVRLTMDAHSELMGSYPWGETTPSQTAYNLQDTAAVSDGRLVFRERGTPPVENAAAHDWAAVVGSALRPATAGTGRGFRGPQGDVVCAASGPDAPEQPERCDDTAYGKGAGGRLAYDVQVPRGGRTVWFAIGGSDRGLRDAQRQQAAALRDPEGVVRRLAAERASVAARTSVDLPGDRLLQRSVEWSKQNLAESVQQSRDLQVRTTNAGTAYPPVKGEVARARWFGAGFPDYPWLFATDGEYTAFAAVAAGQFEPIKDHLRALRDVSLVANGRSGKVVHEVTPDGQVYFGANDDAGNTDETAKLPSAVALVWRWTGDDDFLDEMYPASVRALRYVTTTLDADGDGWPEGNGNVETPGLGEEKLDNTVYTIRGLRDLADLADARGDRATERWATRRAERMESRFEKAWWNGDDTRQYADSLDGDANEQVFQRHWIGVTPAEVSLRRPGQPDGPLASREHARRLLERREEPCYTGTFGLFHTGSGATTPDDDVEGPACDGATSSVPALRQVFTLNTSLMAVAEGALGRTGADHAGRYTTGNARVQLDPSVWELPGAMPEIAPSPDFEANVDRLFTERSMALQAWGAYGILWPVVHQQLGVSPDLGRNRLAVVPQVPDGQRSVAGRDVRLGRGAVDVSATSGRVLRTTVRADRPWRLTIGVVLPDGARVRSATLDGRSARPRLVDTARGTVAQVDVRSAHGTTTLAVSTR